MLNAPPPPVIFKMVRLPASLYHVPNIPIAAHQRSGERG